jgi:hypothetical protein
MTLHADAARRHCLSYDVLTNIPAKILDTRDPEQSSREKDARIVHDALLLKFSAAMPCLRPKQVRDTSIQGAAANLFKGPLNAGFTTAPEWAAGELRRDPAAEFWQIHFSRMETGVSAIRTLLPMNVVPLLEEYVNLHRPCLAGYNDCGKLFLNQRGGPLSADQLTAFVGKLTSRFANCRISPATIRISFAFQWLTENPNDYPTLSQLLRHADVSTTVRMFGIPSYRLSVFDAMCKVEDWAQHRKSKTEEEGKNQSS